MDYKEIFSTLVSMVEMGVDRRFICGILIQSGLGWFENCITISTDSEQWVPALAVQLDRRDESEVQKFFATAKELMEIAQPLRAPRDEAPLLEGLCLGTEEEKIRLAAQIIGSSANSRLVKAALLAVSSYDCAAPLISLGLDKLNEKDRASILGVLTTREARALAEHYRISWRVTYSPLAAVYLSALITEYPSRAVDETMLLLKAHALKSGISADEARGLLGLLSRLEDLLMGEEVRFLKTFYNSTTDIGCREILASILKRKGEVIGDDTTRREDA